MFTNKPITYAGVANLRIRSRRGLPHFELDNGIYYITYRLADALPKHVVRALAEERFQLIRMMCGNRKPSPMELAEAAAIIGEKFDRRLDTLGGECRLRSCAAARIVDGAIRFFDDERYRLIAWCIMPNHVHVVMQLFHGAELDRVLHSWKSFTANEVNKLQCREGTLWQREYFDRIVRDAHELTNVVRYVSENPAKAGMIDWEFAGLRDWWRQ